MPSSRRGRRDRRRRWRPGPARSSAPSAADAPRDRRRRRPPSRPGVPGATTSRASRSESITTAPQLARAPRTTVDLPDPMPPVTATVSGHVDAPSSPSSHRTHPSLRSPTHRPTCGVRASQHRTVTLRKAAGHRSGASPPGIEPSQPDARRCHAQRRDHRADPRTSSSRSARAGPRHGVRHGRAPRTLRVVADPGRHRRSAVVPDRLPSRACAPAAGTSPVGASAAGGSCAPTPSDRQVRGSAALTALALLRGPVVESPAVRGAGDSATAGASALLQDPEQHHVGQLGQGGR